MGFFMYMWDMSTTLLYLRYLLFHIGVTSHPRRPTSRYFRFIAHTVTSPCATLFSFMYQLDYVSLPLCWWYYYNLFFRLYQLAFWINYNLIFSLYCTLFFRLHYFAHILLLERGVFVDNIQNRCIKWIKKTWL